MGGRGETPEESVLIGVDAGASGVRALAAAVAGERVRALAGPTEEVYELARGADGEAFSPLDLDEQRAQQRAPHIQPLERLAGELWVDAAARCIAAAVASVGGTHGIEPDARRVRVGIALPGVKTADGRGTRVVKNGPRIPDYLGQLERRLIGVGLQPVEALGPLQSDGACGGLGELVCERGSLVGLESGYYIGGGSGLAEALVLDGRPVELDAIGDWFPRAYELPVPGPAADAGPRSFEDHIAPGRVNAAWRELTEGWRSAEAVPEEHLDGDVLAVAALTNMGTQLARLIHLRLGALAARDYRLERAVIGQRLAQVMADERTEFFLRRTAERELARLVCFDPDPRLASWYLVEGGQFGRLDPGLLITSDLRSAPALGAAWLAARAAESDPAGSGGPAGTGASGSNEPGPA